MTTAVKPKQTSIIPLHQYSIVRAFEQLTEKQQKEAAQNMRETIDWYGEKADTVTIYNCIMKVIHEYDPKFETKFTPAQ